MEIVRSQAAAGEAIEPLAHRLAGIVNRARAVRGERPLTTDRVAAALIEHKQTCKVETM